MDSANRFATERRGFRPDEKPRSASDGQVALPPFLAEEKDPRRARIGQWHERAEKIVRVKDLLFLKPV